MSMQGEPGMGGSRMNRELVLPPGMYAYVLDSTKGKVSVYVGPTKNSLSETDQPVRWDDREQRYVNVTDTDAARQVWAKAEEGEYIVLTNPAPSTASSDHPPKGQSTEAVELEVGRRVMIPGPCTFPLWPGQTAQTIPGHHLRHNQYVIVRVYDPELAQENWTSAVIAPQVTVPVTPTEPMGSSDQGEAQGDETTTEGDVGDQPTAPTVEVLQPPTPMGLPGEASALTMGQLMVVPGTQVSFYMPSTGLEVVPEGNSYVRDAVTLETLEYCILLDENGQKRYVRGPAVVFPSPTETFKTNENRQRVFRAIELNEQSGLYVKVIAEYTEDGETHPVGEELFVKGSEQAIYYPRAEHSIITYDGRQKHHAIAIPAGEGRYVLNRTTGQVNLVKGPKMFLPDPRTEVVVRRILDPHDVQLMFPGNEEALEVNRRYQRESSTLEGGEHLLSREALRGSSSDALRSFDAGDEDFGGDTMSRGTTHTPPRTITLDTKYEGAVAVQVWPGYAILVTNKTGDRRVEVGPKVVLLEYDETMMALELSTGRPKSDRSLLRTGYLRVVNNVVSDRVTVETKDLVTIQVELSYRVNFEGDSVREQQRWFDVENYVQVLTDHCRSRLRNVAKRYQIREFYTEIIDIIRDSLLGIVPESGGSREGLKFAENGMRVYDVEILDVTIQDPEVARLLTDAQSSALSGAIRLSMAEEEAERTRATEELNRQTLTEQQLTTDLRAELALTATRQRLEQQLADIASEFDQRKERAKVEEHDLRQARKRSDQETELLRARNEAELERLRVETELMLSRLDKVQPGLIEALTSFGDRQLAQQIVTAIGPAALAAGLTTADMLSSVFEGTPLAGVINAFAERPLANGNGSRPALTGAGQD